MRTIPLPDAVVLTVLWGFISLGAMVISATAHARARAQGKNGPDPIEVLAGFLTLPLTLFFAQRVHVLFYAGYGVAVVLFLLGEMVTESVMQRRFYDAVLNARCWRRPGAGVLRDAGEE